MLIEIDDRAHSTILAALRFWQKEVTDHEDFPDTIGDLEDIATNGDRHDPMDSDEIDDLCQEINCAVPYAEGPLKYYVLISRSQEDYDCEGPYDSELEQAEAAVKIWLACDQQNDRLFFIDSRRSPHLGPYPLYFLQDPKEELDKLRKLQELGVSPEDVAAAESRKYWVVVMIGGLEPELYGPYSSAEEQSTAVKELHKKLDEEDNLFWLETVNDQSPVLGTYLSGFFDDDIDDDDDDDDPAPVIS